MKNARHSNPVNRGGKWRIAGVEMMNFGNDHRVIPQLPPIVANYHSPVNSRII